VNFDINLLIINNFDIGLSIVPKKSLLRESSDVNGDLAGLIAHSVDKE